MQSMFCLVDIDSTIYAFEQVVCEIALRDWGVSLQSETPFWGAWEEHMPDMDAFYELLAKVHLPEQILSNEPYPDAVHALQRLHADGLEVRYVSDRSGEALAATAQWLQQQGFPQSEQLSCTQDKRQWMHNHRREISTIIDDRVLTLTHARFQLHLPHVFALRHGWNVNLSDMTGVHLGADWLQLEQLVRKHHLMPRS
jgi:hypothetical protein